MLLCRRRFVKLTADVERLCSYVTIGCQASFATRQAASQTCQWASPPWNPCNGCKLILYLTPLQQPVTERKTYAKERQGDHDTDNRRRICSVMQQACADRHITTGFCYQCDHRHSHHPIRADSCAERDKFHVCILGATTAGNGDQHQPDGAYRQQPKFCTRYKGAGKDLTADQRI